MLAVHKRCCQCRTIKVNRRAGNESRPAYAEGEPRSARRNRCRRYRLIQEWDGIPRRASWLDLYAQETVERGHAGRVGCCSLEIPCPAVGGRSADGARGRVHLQSIRHCAAHRISGFNVTVVHTPLKPMMTTVDRDLMAVLRA